jgi:hypothetical protein
MVVNMGIKESLGVAESVLGIVGKEEFSMCIHLSHDSSSFN